LRRRDWRPINGPERKCSHALTPLRGWLAASVVVFTATPNAAQQMCKPALAVTEASISEAQNRQRTWTGVLTVDASPCSSASGEFEVEFTRLKENAPDLRFVQRFT